MATLTHIETDTGTNVDIHDPTTVGSYTSTGDKLVMVDVSIDQVAGDGDYVMYVTRQIGGAGSAYVILPKTTMTAAPGETAISGQSGWITVRNGDVLTVYVDGLAGDTSTPDWSTRWFESAVLLVTLADDAIKASTFDESTAFPLKSADTGSTQVARVGADSDTLETLSDQLDAIVEDTGTTIPAAITGLNDIAVSDIMNEVVVGTYTFEQLLKVMSAALAGKLSGGGTATLIFRGIDDTSDVIVATIDANNNRTAVTLDLT